MIPDMKELIEQARKLGYKLVRYDEFEKKKNEVIKERYMLVFEVDE